MSTSCDWEGKGRYGSFRLRMNVWVLQVKLWNPLRTRAIPERFCGGDSLRRGAISSVCTLPYLLMRTNLFVPSHFWTPDAKFDNCSRRYIATRGNFFYIGYTFLALKYCSRIFWNVSAIYLSIRSGAHKLFCRFLDFHNFWPQFPENCDAT